VFYISGEPPPLMPQNYQPAFPMPPVQHMPNMVPMGQFPPQMGFPSFPQGPPPVMPGPPMPPNMPGPPMGWCPPSSNNWNMPRPPNVAPPNNSMWMPIWNPPPPFVSPPRGPTPPYPPPPENDAPLDLDARIEMLLKGRYPYLLWLVNILLK